MKVLAIETSCDETALAALNCSYIQTKKSEVDEEGELTQEGNGLHFSFSVISSIIHSQVELHAKYGGVFPMMAKREHTKNILPLLKQLIIETKESMHSDENEEALALNQIANELLLKNRYGEIKEELKKICEKDIDLFTVFETLIEIDTASFINPEFDAIVVTVGPGLEPALWVGITLSKMFALLWDIPLLPGNHMEGHVVSVLFNKDEPVLQSTQTINFPAVSLLISGGHTEIALMRNWNDYKILGQTLDDAVGEAFDKVARMMNLPYPGGPEISKHAEKFRNKKLKGLDIDIGDIEITLPRPMISAKNLNFSFSGIKTAVLYLVRDIKQYLKIDETTNLPNEIISAIASEFENAVTEVLIKKTCNAHEETGATTLTIGGGVIANTYIRAEFERVAEAKGITLLIPPRELTTDNAIMIGMAGYISQISNILIKKKSRNNKDALENEENSTENLFKAKGNLVIGNNY